MREQQRAELTERVAAILDEPAPHADYLEAARILYGATPAELTEVVANLDGTAAVAYQTAYGSTV